MTRLFVIGRWMQVIGAVVAWFLLVPVFELVRAVIERLSRAERGGDGPARDDSTPVASRPAILQEHGRGTV